MNERVPNCMEDLSDIPPTVILDSILNWTVRGAGSRIREVHIYLTTFIRMADKAILEHEQARHALAGHNRGEKTISLVFRAVDHLENCLNTIHRALNYLERLRSHRLGPEIPRVVRRWIEANTREVGSIRNAVEHMDEMVAKGEVIEGQAVALFVTPDGNACGIGPHSITFSALAAVIRKLHALALELSDYRDK